MGMYTELIFGAELKKETPNEVIEKLKSMVDDSYNEGRNVFYPNSYYFGVSNSRPFMKFDDISQQWVISTRGNVKNYNGEIECFLEWIKPYIDSGSGARDMYAIVTYEEDDEPTIYYLH